MQGFLVPVQVKFRLKFALALVTSEPSHGFRGGVFEHHVMFQIVLSLRPVCAVEAVEPFRFFVWFVQFHMTFQVVFPFCFVAALLTLKPHRLFVRRVLEPLVLPQLPPLPCFEIAFVALQPYVRMVQFCVSLQVVFDFGLVRTLVASKPLHGFGCGVFQVHVTSQVSFTPSPVLTIEAVKPLSFFVRFVQIHVTFKRVFQFCFVRTLLALQPQRFFVCCVFDQFVIFHFASMFRFEVALVTPEPLDLIFIRFVSS
jgi:hypothetical protein